MVQETNMMCTEKDALDILANENGRNIIQCSPSRYKDISSNKNKKCSGLCIVRNPGLTGLQYEYIYEVEIVLVTNIVCCENRSIENDDYFRMHNAGRENSDEIPLLYR